MKTFLKWIVAVSIFEIMGLLGTYFVSSSVSGWYLTLSKPSFNPPAWVFGPVWILLYGLIGASFYRIYKGGFRKKNERDAISVFIIQIILNLIWAPIFFGARSIVLSLIIIVALIYFIFQTIKNFYSIDKWAAYLLLPYFFWVIFAAILNFSIWILNR